VRTMTAFARGRLAIESIAARPDLKAARIGEARQMARSLMRERDPWAGVAASMVTAATENASGNRAAALAALRAGLEKAVATDSVLYAVVVRYRLGQMLGGDEGRAMTRAALDDAIALGARNPERWLGLYLPGQWSAPQ
jgi:eukaryotic-like serine/threonine-protein kinase